MKLSRRAVLAGLVVGGFGAVGLSGCGFRLRGTGAMAGASYQSVLVMGLEKVPAELANALRQQWQGLGVALVDSMAQADVAVQLGGYNRSISRTSFSATGETTSELIKLTQDFVAFRVEDEAEIINTQVMALRDRQTDPNQQLAAARELQDIERQMQGDLARQLIDRINRAYRKLPGLVVEENTQDEPQPETTEERPQ